MVKAFGGFWVRRKQIEERKTIHATQGSDRKLASRAGVRGPGVEPKTGALFTCVFYANFQWLPYSNVTTQDGKVVIGGPMGNILESLRVNLNFT